MTLKHVTLRTLENALLFVLFCKCIESYKASLSPSGEGIKIPFTLRYGLLHNRIQASNLEVLVELELESSSMTVWQSDLIYLKSAISYWSCTLLLERKKKKKGRFFFCNRTGNTNNFHKIH